MPTVLRELDVCDSVGFVYLCERGLVVAKEEEQGFVIRDKRGQSSEESVPSEPSQEKASTSEDPRASASEGNIQQDSDGPSGQAPPLSFSSFILSLGTSSLMLMGEKLSPEQPSTPVNLPQAKEIVDILSILETKTQGNLTAEEAAVIKDMLYTLRMKYVEASSGKSPAA